MTAFREAFPILAGGTEVLPPTNQPWGERMCAFVDPNGHLIHVGAKA